MRFSCFIEQTLLRIYLHHLRCNCACNGTAVTPALEHVAVHMQPLCRSASLKPSPFLSWFLNSWHVATQQLLLPAGASADRCEQKGEAEVKAEAVSTLRRLFGEQVPEPTASVMTCWRQEPYSRGGPPAVYYCLPRLHRPCHSGAPASITQAAWCRQQDSHTFWVCLLTPHCSEH